MKVAQTLSKNGFKAIDLTHDDLARDHIRHMVGGHSTLAKDERLLRFEFPERPGALMKFLSAMRPGWNISLFHYRNQGADYGRILVGLQVPEADNKAFAAFLKTLGYPYVEETNNPVYRLFLKSLAALTRQIPTQTPHSYPAPAPLPFAAGRAPRRVSK